MSWHFVERWLQKVYQHSTLVGKFWITFLIIFRIVVVSSISDRVYSDEQSEFKCNTAQIGCGNVCFNKFSPMSHIRFWSFQIIMVCTPTILFMVYSAHQIRPDSKDKKEERIAKILKQQKERTEKGLLKQRQNFFSYSNNDFHDNFERDQLVPHNQSQKQKLKKMYKKSINPDEFGAKTDVHPVTAQFLEKMRLQKLGIMDHPVDQETTGSFLPKDKDREKETFMKHFLLYAISVMARTVIELLFICIQWYTFGWKVANLYKCVGFPCPNTVDCYVSRPWEKTILLWFMYFVAVLSTVMNLIEMNYLLSYWISNRLKDLKEKREKTEEDHRSLINSWSEKRTRFKI